MGDTEVGEQAPEPRELRERGPLVCRSRNQSGVFPPGASGGLSADGLGAGAEWVLRFNRQKLFPCEDWLRHTHIILH